MQIPVSTFLLQLTLVILVGGVIGSEREFRSKSAGFRTIILICLGSYLFTIFSLNISKSSPDRIAANIVTGIGFLGAGVIFRGDRKVNGITTAATIWSTAALGMGIAAGYYFIVLVSTGLVIVALYLFNYIERVIDSLNLSRNYKVLSVYQDNLLKRIEKEMKECNLRFRLIYQNRKDNYISATWLVYGKEVDHNKFVEQILRDETVKEFEF
ncbi:MAG: MgtC/SapB family protein [Candidatus Dadabacteria bacterium]